MTGTAQPGGSLREALDPFAQMRRAQERVNQIRDLATRWISEVEPDLPTRGYTIPASPDDVFWLCERLDRVLATMQDAAHAYGIVDTDRNPVEAITPMMVERDALAEALGGD